jgi:hypothetical protein
VTRAGLALNGSIVWMEENIDVLQSAGGASAQMRFYNLGIVDGGVGKHRRGWNQIGGADGATPASGGKVAAWPGGGGEGESRRE